jgi:hypothetical protein
MKKETMFTETVIGGLQTTIANLKSEITDFKEEIKLINSHMITLDLKIGIYNDINLKLQKYVTKLEEEIKLGQIRDESMLRKMTPLLEPIKDFVPFDFESHRFDCSKMIINNLIDAFPNKKELLKEIFKDELK